MAGKDLDVKIRAAAKNRCGYCLVPQKLISYTLEIEHLIPKSKGGETVEENLWLSCRQCNLNKAAKTVGFDLVTFKRVAIFNPREQFWHEEFVWSPDATEIIGITPCGRATVTALKLNSDIHVIARGFWRLTGVFPPQS
ncbi:MAG: HNH endonuclease signature motif containing protein [Pyrinomonadaceae bacterium]